MLGQFSAVAGSVTAAMTLAFLGGCQTGGEQRHIALGYPLGTSVALTHDDLRTILDQGTAAARQQKSLLRVDPATGAPLTTCMHIFVVDRAGSVAARVTMADAWAGSVSIAHAKAFTALAFSSDQNALTSRSIGALSQPGGPLWQIGNSNTAAHAGLPGLIQFPGGLPLYKDGRLVGGVGVSGDGVDEDEAVARAAAKGFEPPATIRIDTVTKGAVPYTK